METQVITDILPLVADTLQEHDKDNRDRDRDRGTITTISTRARQRKTKNRKNRYTKQKKGGGGGGGGGLGGGGGGGPPGDSASEGQQGAGPQPPGPQGGAHAQFRLPSYKFRGGVRKRSCSFTAGTPVSKFFLPYKRPRKDAIIPPTKFLLGGNISDPLNLNSLQDEDVNRAMNAVTPKSSPLPTPPRHRAKIDVIIPPDLRDPLNLIDPLDNEEYEKRLTHDEDKPRKPKRRARSKRRSAETEPPRSPAPAAVPLEPEPPDPASAGTEACSFPPPPPAPPPRELRLEVPSAKARKRTASDSERAKKDIKKARRMDALDKIVSPVVPQPGSWIRIHSRQNHANKQRPQLNRSDSAVSTAASVATTPMPKFKSRDAKYQYGNYDRYYGYRNLNSTMDIRLKIFVLNRHLFNNKDVLDIGCNVGHIAIAVARDLGAKSVTGIDIDKSLIASARKNLRNFVVVPTHTVTKMDDSAMSTSQLNRSDEKSDSFTKDECEKKEAQSKLNSKSHNDSQLSHKHKKGKRNRRSHHKPNHDAPKHYFPISFPILYGPAEVKGCPLEVQTSSYPHNIVFKQANYVLKDESLINADVAQYDLILCLSVTKWIHLNWGDNGLKLAFKRMFAQLRPGGKLILEAQNWASYKKKKKLTETIYKNFSSIEFHPAKFREYLLSPEVGFSKCCVLGVPQHLSKGFRRPIHLYIKGDFTPSKVQWSDTYAPSNHQSDSQFPVSEGQPKKVYANFVNLTYNPSPLWSHQNTPLYVPFTPPVHTQSVDSPAYYNPLSDYLPSYTSSGTSKPVYTSFSSPLSEGGTPLYVSEGHGPTQGVYASMASPASPFLEPSPGNSTTPSHPYTPSHSASYDHASQKKVYASLHSPHEECSRNPVYSPSVPGSSRRSAPSSHSPMHAGKNIYLLPEAGDGENTNSNDSLPVKGNLDVFTPDASPRNEVHNNVEVTFEHQSPRDISDQEYSL